MDNLWIIYGYVWYVLWLCQQFAIEQMAIEIVSFPRNSMVVFHTYFKIPEGTPCTGMISWCLLICITPSNDDWDGGSEPALGFIDQFWSHSWRANTNMKVRLEQTPSLLGWFVGLRFQTSLGIIILHFHWESCSTNQLTRQYFYDDILWAATAQLTACEKPGLVLLRRFLQVMVLLLYYNQACMLHREPGPGLEKGRFP